MYIYDYFWFLVAILVCAIFSGYASLKVHRAYNKYGRVMTRSRVTGYEAARRIAARNSLRGLSIGRVSGSLTDHYDPRSETVNLSASTYDSSSVAAVAVAAHEMGHVMQKERGYLPYRLRTVLVPVVNIGSFLAMPLVLIGVLLDFFLLGAGANENLGFFVAMIGVVLYGGSFFFTLVTLPVELNASRRAKKMLLAEGILSGEEVGGASAVLSAAALTYLASLFTSLIYFLRFIVYVLSIFGRRSRR